MCKYLPRGKSEIILKFVFNNESLYKGKLYKWYWFILVENALIPKKKGFWFIMRVDVMGYNAESSIV